jgi:hypothetical protein
LRWILQAMKKITSATAKTIKPMVSVSKIDCALDCAYKSHNPKTPIFSSTSGGRGGIRTHGTLAGTPVFKTGALNHSATLPAQEFQSLSVGLARTQCERGPDVQPIPSFWMKPGGEGVDLPGLSTSRPMEDFQPAKNYSDRHCTIVAAMSDQADRQRTWK